MLISDWSSDVCSSDLEVGLAPVGVGEDAAIHDLQQDVEDVRVRLLDLVEQQHAVRRLDDLLGQQAALVEADVARGRADQAADRMRFHVLAHVEAHQLDAQLQRELLGHLGLAHAGGAGEQEVADRRSEEHTSELQSLMRISYAVFCLKKKKTHNDT